MKISIILTTYNWPEALNLALASLAVQTYSNFEIIIADDGSTEETAKVIKQWRLKLKQPLKHVWQEDDGFQAAKIRNKAILASSGDYLVFLDGDCFVRENFMLKHLQLVEKRYFVVGQRVLCSQNFSAHLLDETSNIKNSLFYWIKCRWQSKINRFVTLLSLPLGHLRKFAPKKWKGAKTCNLGVWKNDLLHINGFDESFQGWGYEDSDMVIRLIRSGVRRKTARFAAPVFHLWHKFFDRTQEVQNKKRLQKVLRADYIRAKKGIIYPNLGNINVNR